VPDVLSTEYQTLREYAVVLRDVDLTEIGVSARELLAAEPEPESVQRLNEVIDVMLTELWNRLQDRLLRWHSRHRQTSARFRVSILTETLQGLSDIALETYAQAAEAEMNRSANESETARYRESRRVCLRIIQARTAARRVITSLGIQGSGGKRSDYHGVERMANRE
jgi:hypothetical protein